MESIALFSAKHHYLSEWLTDTRNLYVADTNHPLSRYPLTLEARLIEKWQPAKERGGGCNDIASVLTGNGPGMQIPYQWAAKDCYTPLPFP